MPDPDTMKSLEDELEAAIAAKRAKAIIDALNKVKNEQQRYDDMVKQEMSYSKRMDSEDSEGNMRKAGLGTIEKKSFPDFSPIEKKNYDRLQTIEKKSFPDFSPIEKKNYDRLPVLLKKGEDALMDLKED